MKLHILFRVAVAGLLTLHAGSVAAQEVFILHGPRAKDPARSIEGKLPKPLPTRLYNAGLLALADEAGRTGILALINSARVLVLADRGAARLLGDEELTVPVVAVDIPAADIGTSRGSVIVWTEDEAPEASKIDVVSDLEGFTAPDPGSDTELEVTGDLSAHELAAACVVGWIPELARPVLIVNARNPVKDLPRTQVVHLLNKRQQLWPDRKRVELFLPPEESHAFSELLRVVYKTDARGLERLWSQRLYTNKITAIPRHMPSAGAAIVTVARRRLALSVVRASAIPRRARVAVLTVDGHSFLSGEYLFR